MTRRRRRRRTWRGVVWELVLIVAVMLIVLLIWQPLGTWLGERIANEIPAAPQQPANRR